MASAPTGSRITLFNLIVGVLLLRLLYDLVALCWLPLVRALSGIVLLGVAGILFAGFWRFRERRAGSGRAHAAKRTTTKQRVSNG